MRKKETAVSPDQRLAYEQSRATADDLLLCIRDAFLLLGQPRTLIDVGCGPGHVVDMCRELNIVSVGVDICIEHQHTNRLIRHDLTEPWLCALGAAEMTLCLEVGEHLPESAADTLCETLMSNTSKVLLFSAATPSQGGAGHINEQLHAYWIAKLTYRGELYVDDVATRSLRGRWSELASDAWWYGRNLIVFRRVASRYGSRKIGVS